jgi:peptidoglycan L-alanyl-D-glutamate endopeptidase CwlK
MDIPTKQRIEKLHPNIRQEVTNIITEIDQALTGRAKIRISQGLRTNAEQDALYAIGRTIAGKIVTNSKGGQSVHNYGFAVDIVLIIDGKASWDIKKDWDGDRVSDWDECVKIFAKHGWSWGGSWKRFKDFPHFEKIGFNNWRVLQNLTKNKDGYIKI